ncbi:hypothetical protein C8T65DRAFT_672412 [Cerioporus squamosus]|nr:hypothetical protein C8T65DRAFT_672412 [Cerioporus squamosus]
MPQCQALSTERCQRSAQEAGLYCAEHAADSSKLVEAFHKAKREADALEILVVDMQSTGISEQLRDCDEAGAAAAVLKTYVDRLDKVIKMAEKYEVLFGAENSLSSKECISELRKKRDAALELHQVESWKSMLRGLDPKSHTASVPQHAQAAETQCQAFLETEGCTPCPDSAAQGRRFCLAHDLNHSRSLSSLEKARTQCRESLDDYESVFGSGPREETMRFLQKYIVSLRTVIGHLQEHQQQFHCKMEEQHAAAVTQLTEKRRKAMSQVDDLVMWGTIVSLGKKAAPFGSLAFFVLLLCIVLSQ